MMLSQFDVLVVGAGAAGLTAAIGLRRAGFTVAVVEAAAYPGAANWYGCVYFTENLADPDILGPDGVESLAWERRLIERGFFATDGHGLLGMTYRDAGAFRHCYTVLRPIFDRHLGQLAVRSGAALFSATTVESLIRDDGRVIGVATNRGPLYADLVFLAEGDASHLVTREGYERSADPRDAPQFMLGIKEVMEFAPGVIEERFGVGAEDGIAYDLLLRNTTLAGRVAQLNMRGLLCTNRQSLSVGLVLPIANLARHFKGDPNLLLEWFEGLPALQPWLRGGQRGVFGAKLIRSGGANDVPTLIDDGLAIGGAASGIGVHFPYMNFIGPATATGRLLVQAVRAIRAEGGGFTRAALARHYLEPLRSTHYWKDMEFLRRWPNYVRRSRVLFGRHLDLALGSACVWTRPDRWFGGKFRRWLRVLRDEMTPWNLAESRADVRRLSQALRFREALGRPALWQLLLDGFLNALRDLLRRPRAHLSAAGALRFHFRAAEGSVRPPRSLRRWFERFEPVLAGAAGTTLRNDDRPLSLKLPTALNLLLRQLNLIDCLAVIGFALVTGMAAIAGAGWRMLRARFVRQPRPHPEYVAAAQRTTDLTEIVARAAGTAEERLASVPFTKEEPPSIHVLWPMSLIDRDMVVGKGPWHVCPTHVFDVGSSARGQVQVSVHAERCIQCEACWRSSELVDWGRNGVVLFAPDALPRPGDSPWDRLPSMPAAPPALSELLDALERSLERFEIALREKPDTIGRDRAEYFEILARHAQQLARRAADLLPQRLDAEPARRLMIGLVGKAAERAKHTWDRHFAWAAADGRHMRQHHLTGLRHLFSLSRPSRTGAPVEVDAPVRDGRLNESASRLCERAIEFATTQVRFPGLFQDDEGRDTLGKFGAVKRRIATMAANLLIIEALGSSDGAAEKSLVAEAFQAIVWDAGQVLGRVSRPESRAFPTLEDAAAWRERGLTLLGEWQADNKEGITLADLQQAQTLLKEWEQIGRLRARLIHIVNDWHRQNLVDEATTAAIAEQLARLDARVSAARVLLMRTQCRLDDGLDVELDIPLLRVWLQETGTALDSLAAQMARPDGEDRPIVEPGTPPPLTRFADFLDAKAVYESGDFLIAPIDLRQPVAVPEMADFGGHPTGHTAMLAALLAQLQQVDQQTRDFATGRPEFRLPCIDWRLRALEEDEFLAAAVLCDVIGLASHAGTRSCQLEIAIAKMLGIETVQHAQELAETIGPAYDSNSSAIAEGASIFQRFLILKTLTTETAPRWAPARPRPRHLAREPLELEALKAAFRQRLDAARALFGQSLWQNPNLQANVFNLAEIAAWLKAADSVLRRLAWLCRRGGTAEDPAPRNPVGACVLARILADLRNRLTRFDIDLAALRRGHYAPHVRAASLLFAT